MDDPFDSFEGLMLAFDTDEPEFTRGFEIGVIWAKLRSLPPECVEVRFMIHTTNLEMCVRMVESLSWWALRPEAVEDESATDDWTIVIFTRS